MGVATDTPESSDHGLSDFDLMGLALEEARLAGEQGEVPIGAVVVIDGKVVARRHNEREQSQDPTSHAELLAVRDAAAAIGSWRLENATVVVTLEPCAMCAGLMVNARVGRVVFGARSYENGACGSLYQLGSDPRLNHEFVTVADVRADECSELLSATSVEDGKLPERTNGAASKAVVAFGSPRVRIPHFPPSMPAP